MKVDMDPSTTRLSSSSTTPDLARIPEPIHSASSNEALTDILSGSLAGALGKIVEFPFDTVKVRLQSQPDHLPLRYAGPIDCFRQSWKAEGVRGLYRGVSAPLVGAGAETACLFCSYRVAQGVLVDGFGLKGEEGLGLGSLVMAGAMAGGLTSLILTPIELVKCRMQVPIRSTVDPSLGATTTGGRARTMGPLAVIAEVYRREGVRGFWRGQLGTFFRETGGTAAWFGSYEASSLFFRRRQQLASNASPSSTFTEKDTPLPVHQQMLSGALAGMSYNFLFYPADTIKSQIQTGEFVPAGVRRVGFMGVGRAIWRVHGLKGLYRGCGITVARSAPSSALIFTVVERLKGWWG